jgi:hypothetical protein
MNFLILLESGNDSIKLWVNKTTLKKIKEKQYFQDSKRFDINLIWTIESKRASSRGLKDFYKKIGVKNDK